MKSHLLALLALVLFTSSMSAQVPKSTVKLTATKVTTVDHVYKQTAEGELTLHGFLPPDWKATDKRPVIVFFFGGGWKNGSYTQFVPQAEYFASWGLVTFSADYRIESKHKTTPASQSLAISECFPRVACAFAWGECRSAAQVFFP